MLGDRKAELQEAVERVRASGLFDAEWYLKRYPDVAKAGVDPLVHFVRHGDKHGRSPGPLFDAKYYLRANPEVGASGVPPFEHYLQQGREEGRLPLDPDASVRKVPPKKKAAAKKIDAAALERVRASGLFDAEWYLKRYPDVAAAGVDPLMHFVRHGDAQGRSPGPLFDAGYYLRVNQDLRAEGVRPFEHYLRHGREEGRAPRNPHAPGLRGRPLLPIDVSPVAPQRLACVVHAFYPEVFAEEIAPLLKNVPFRFSLFVAVPSAAAADAVQQAIAGNEIPARSVVRVVPNRGRNFGSFLAEFSEKLTDFDLVLHLHTKKSLYTGKEQGAWRSGLFNALVGSPEVVRLVLGAFSRNPELGLVYPRAHKHLPYWAYHWLQNSWQGRRLLDRLGVRNASTSGYLDYPVGGMFWARVDALRPLFDARLAYSDFPEEAGQTDGTLAHAIERAVGVLASARGYRFAEFDYDACRLRNGWSCRHLDQYAHASTRAQYERLVAEVDVVSFDVFDTLLVRPSRAPDSLLRYVGFTLERGDAACSDFFVHRKRAEDVAREKKFHQGDVSLSEIYRCFPDVCDWSADRIEKARQAEIAIEDKLLHARTPVRELVEYARQQGKRVLAISDSYYSREYLQGRLEAAGYGGMIDRVYVSSHEQCRKDRGDLWDKVAQTESLPRDRWLHVGDDERSDVQGACDRGIRYFHTMRPSVLVDAVDPAGAGQTGTWADDLLVGPATLKLAIDPIVARPSLSPVSLEDAFDSGFAIFGPIIFRFLAWLVTHPTLRQLSHLHFLSREGFLLVQIYESLKAKYPQLELPPATYVYVSRRAVLSAVQGIEFTPETLLEGFAFQGSLNSLLKSRIGLELPEAYGSSEWEISLPRDRETALAALRELEEPIVEHAQVELDALRSYLDSIGLTGPEPQGVVDIGYGGTIQRCLQLIQGTPLVGLYFATTKAARETSRTGGYAYGCFAEEISHVNGGGVVVAENSLLLESFLTASHGQVERLVRQGDRFAPAFKRQVLAPETVDTLLALQKGASAYCEELLESFGPDLLFAPFSKHMAQRFMAMFVNGAVAVPDDVLRSLCLEDDFCGQGVVSAARNVAPGV